MSLVWTHINFNAACSSFHPSSSLLLSLCVFLSFPFIFICVCGGLMEERVRQLQSRLPMDSRLQAGGAHGRYNPHPNSFFPHQNELEFERLQSRMPVQTLSTRFPSAPVPLEPWDREAILDYRNRVNANSISANPQNSAEEDRGRRVFDNNAQRLRQIFDDSMDFHRSNGHCNLRKLEKKFERTERLGFRQEPDRFRNMQNPAVYGRSQRGERPDWPGSRVREEPLYENFGRTQSEFLRDQRVRENPDPNPNLISPEERNLSEMRFRYAERIGLKRMNLKRLREVESEDFGRNLMGRSSKYRELGLANDTRSFADRLAERTERWSDRQLCFGPERDMYLGSVAAQSKVRLQQNELQSRADLQRNLIQVGGQKKMICRADQSENELACAENCFGMVGLRERPGSIRAENPSMQGMDDHDNLMLQREPGSSKEDITAATYGMQSTVKNEHVFPNVTKGHSSAGIALGLPQLAKSEGKVQIKGGKLGTPGGLCTKKPNIMHENKNGVWVQSSKKKGKQKRARLLGSAPQRPGSLASLEDGQISHVRQVSDLPEQALEVKQPIHSCQDRERGKMPRIDRSQYERSTADLSVFFKPNGLVAQEVMTSLDKNPRDNANNSSLRELIPASSLLDEEVKEHFNTGSVESISSLDQRKSMTDNQKAVAQSKASPTALLQENIPTSEKESIVESNSRQPFWHLDGIDAKTMMPSAIQSQDRVDPHKTLPLDCKENGNVTVADAKQFDDVPPTAESLLTHAPSFNLEEGLSCTTCSKPNSTDVQDTGLNGSCLGQSTRNAVDMINDSERPQKKFRVNQREELALMAHVISEDPLSTSSVLQPGIEATESQRPMATGQAHLNAALKSGVIQQSAGAFETHSSQKAATSSQNPRLCSSLSQRRSSTFCPPTRPKVIASSVRAARPQTWHRTSNLTGSYVMARPSVILNDDTPAGQSLTKACSSQRAAYVRKGNSLVRTSGPAMGLPGKVPVLPRPSSGGQWTKASPMRNMSKAGDLRKILATGTGNKFVSKGTVSATKYGRSTASSETPRTATLAQTTRLEDCITGSPQSSSHAVMKGTADELAIPTSGSSVIDPVKVVNGHIPGAVNIATESQVTSVPHNLSQIKSNPSEDQGENAGVQMIYVKRKSNQLIAATASKPQGSTASISESGQSLSNCPVQDSYYKRKKNQLVRSSMPMETRNTDVERVSGGGCFPDTKEELKAPKFKTQRSRSVLQTKLGRVLKQKRHGTLQSSWVWTLGGAQFSSASLPLLQTRRAITSLFPWKRPFYGRMNCLGKIKAVPNANKGSLLSLISKRLKRLQKRDAVYTKSVNGFALHRSGVLSLGGSNLKWTKSIEKRSKQANEEATMAVAAAEKKKREEKEAVAEAATAAAQAKAERRAVRKAARGIRLHARERIIHVGLVRYKIDPSKWTLQRIPDGRSTCSPDSSLASQIIDTAGLLTPRKRTIIGDEYLRVGNGNQLVRDPRMVSRVLASEKVRWSLHTARSRLAKKQQYCQFFTRFGKCNKEDGKCPYIHDPEKVAVCTKFLKGTCVNVTCKLTHKIIPERMPDCSYFLRGYCTNENCPYRHVNVNPKAPVCEGFLKGYCADGEKCNKKHTYVCPHYAVGGECPERSTCKLHHPKKKDKPKVSSGRKRNNNSKRRYFVAEDLCGGESGCTLLNVHDSEQGELDMPLEATECADFISLNVSWEDPIDHDTSQGTGDPIQRAKSDFDGNLGPPTDDVDMLIKPVRLLWKGPVIDGSMD